MPKIRVTFEDAPPHHFESASADNARPLSSLFASHGFPLNTRCGERGLCRGCEVRIESGAVTVSGQTVEAPAVIRACQAFVRGSAEFRIPARSRMEHRPQVGETFRIDIPTAHQPLFQPEPGGCDTAFAVDVGTTTVVVLLVDLTTGEVLSRAGAFNEQIRFGDNVLTRIDAGRDPAAVRAMQSAIVNGTIAPLLQRACERADRSMDRVAGGALAGNTTMLHLLAGEDPTSLGVAPFKPRFLEGRRLTAGQIGFDCLAPETPLQLLPGIAGYIGADIVAGIYATGMLFDSQPSLLVDIGTNGEVVLQTGSRLVACATAAGPAFEGSGLRCGTRAREGAISDFRLSLAPFALDLETIGGIPLIRASGMCGSAYIDFLAQTRSAGLLTVSGRFDDAAWGRLPEAHRMSVEFGRGLRLAGTGGDGGIFVTEADIALLLQAKAAIGAGIDILLESGGLTAPGLSRVYLAGGFGMHLDVQHAIDIGLLPGFKASQVEVVGNASLAGALVALVDRGTLDEMETIRARTDVLELNLQEEFEDRYIDHLMLP